MKYILFLAFIILVSCQKDQLAPTENKLEEKAVVWDGTERKPTVTDETGERIGAFYPLYYKESVTTDNWTTLDTQHVQEAFNKKQIDSIYLARIAKTNRIRIYNVWHLYYKLVFKLSNGGELVYGTVWSVDAGNVVKYAPFGSNVVEILGFKVSVTRTKETINYGNWIAGINQTKHKYKIKVDTTNLYDDFINGTNGGIFVMPHK
jgi:hypothetical protein